MQTLLLFLVTHINYIKPNMKLGLTLPGCEGVKFHPHLCLDLLFGRFWGTQVLG